MVVVPTHARTHHGVAVGAHDGPGGKAERLCAGTVVGVAGLREVEPVAPHRRGERALTVAEQLRVGGGVVAAAVGWCGCGGGGGGGGVGICKGVRVCAS